MNEVKLLFTAIAATTILDFATMIIASFKNKETGKVSLSKQFLNAFGIEHYTLCEKALCKMVVVTVALLFISVYEILNFENAADFSINTGIFFGVSGIVLSKFLFASLLKITDFKGFYKQIFYSHILIFATMAAKVYELYP